METVDPLYRVCLIGPECTGKSTIAARLAERYGTVWVPEYAREYAERVGRPLTADDADPIARGQLANEDRLAPTASGILILDTDLVSTLVYAKHYYTNTPEWIEGEARTRLAHLYLLFAPDFEFAPDGVRDADANRLAIHAAMRAALDHLGARYAQLAGGWAERLQQAIAVIEAATYSALSLRERVPRSGG